ncbi:MAG: glycosyltransferase family 4 protein [Parcubacteria group bacterium]|nr:glycosyltransferase family 4 protein [Parcubacteria group bacterium]
MAEKIKILQIITLSEWGGAQGVVYDLTTNLPKDKFLVEVAVSPDGLLVERLREKGIKVYEIPSLQREIGLMKDIKTMFVLFRLIRKGKYDIVHCHSTKAGLLGRLAAKLARTKDIYFTAHSWGFYNKEEYGKKVVLFKWFQKIGSMFSSKIVCVSEKVKQDGLKNKIAKANKFLVIKNGIDFQLKDTKQGIREQMGIPQDKIIIVMTARLAHPKNPLMFLEASKIVKNTFPEIKFMLIGDGIFMDECKEFVQNNNLGHTSALLGEKTPEQTRKLMKACDVFVLCSKFEGMPITIIEAMFAGLPIVASDVGGVGELVKNNQNGFLLKTQNPEELAERIIYLAKNKNKSKQLGNNSRIRAQKGFSVQRMVEQYTKLYG